MEAVEVPVASTSRTAGGLDEGNVQSLLKWRGYMNTSILSNQ